ncbi:MAG: PIN domain-containing protein [Candidatus Marsarchaeota archaeon]|nr:PIN domain-containing protein [Candidatus Marsarchaeota archaeon]
MRGDESYVAELSMGSISAANIEIVTAAELNKFEKDAEMASPTKNDAPYFAVALYKHCKIWPNDKLIKKQDIVGVIPTSELLATLDNIK